MAEITPNQLKSPSGQVLLSPSGDFLFSRFDFAAASRIFRVKAVRTSPGTGNKTLVMEPLRRVQFATVLTAVDSRRLRVAAIEQTPGAPHKQLILEPLERNARQGSMT